MYNRVVCAVWIGLLFHLVQMTGAEMVSYDIETIAQGLLAAEAQFTDLLLDYVESSPAWRRETDTYEPRIIEGQYAQKLPQRMRRLERRVFGVHPETGERMLLNDDLFSFNGKATLMLHRKTESNVMRASISEGYETEAFLYADCPQDAIWRHGSRSYAALLIENRDAFHIETDSEILEDAHAIKVVGTVTDGRLVLKMWVSPDYGFLPLKVQVLRARDNKLGREVVLSSLTSLPNGLWYPQRIRQGSPDPREATTYDIKKISVQPIAEEFFTPKIPSATSVQDHVLGLTYTTEVGNDVGIKDPYPFTTVVAQNVALASKALDEYVEEADKQELQGEKAGTNEVHTEDSAESRIVGFGPSSSGANLRRIGQLVLFLLAAGALIALLIRLYWKGVRP